MKWQSTGSQQRPADAIFRPALTLMTGRFLGFIVAFFIPMVLVRLFSQEEFGTYKQLFLIFGTLLGIAQIGMAESLFYFLPSERKKGGSFVFNTFVGLGLVGIVCFAGLWLLSDFIAGLMNNPALSAYLPYVGLYLLFMLAAVLLEIVMTVRRQHFAASCLYALTDVLRSLLLITPVLIFPDLTWLLWGAVAFAVLRFVITLAYILKEFGASLTPDKVLLKRHLAYALPFGLAGMIEMAQGSFHMYAVSYYFDVATFAIYAVGCLQVPLLGFLTSSTGNVMMTTMRERLLEGGKSQAGEVWADSVRKMALSMFPLVAALMVVAHEMIILLFTDTYARSVPVFIIWTATAGFAVLLTDSVLRVFAETRFLILLNLVQLALIALTIPWFISYFGLIGAVLVTLVSTVVRNLLALARIRHLLALPFAELLPWGALGACLALSGLAMLPSLVLRSMLELPLVLTLLTSGLVFCLSYFGLLMQWGPMHRDEKHMLLQWMRVPVSWTSSVRGS